MLAQRPHDKATLFASPGILKQVIHNPLLGVHASLSLAVRYLHQRLKDALDSQSLGFAEREALPLLRLERHVTGIAVLVEQRLEAACV